MPDHWISQTTHKRIVVVGQLVPSGGTCTVLFIADGEDGWVLHPFGLDQGAVHLTNADVQRLVEGLAA